jgi:hypothetical protein
MTALFLYRNEMKSICDEIGSPQRYHDEKKPSATPQQEVFSTCKLQISTSHTWPSVWSSCA